MFAVFSFSVFKKQMNFQQRPGSILAILKFIFSIHRSKRSLNAVSNKMELRAEEVERINMLEPF
jgi:hypothetical protein